MVIDVADGVLAEEGDVFEAVAVEGFGDSVGVGGYLYGEALVER